MRGKFYNDSKATSVDATVKALEAFADESGKIVLILGGRGKKAPYAPLASLVRERVRKLVLVGEDAETIERELGNLAPSERAKDMGEAVTLSFQSAQWRNFLLAPACASFDIQRFEHGEGLQRRSFKFKFQVSSSKGAGFFRRGPKIELET